MAKRKNKILVVMFDVAPLSDKTWAAIAASLKAGWRVELELWDGALHGVEAAGWRVDDHP